MRIFACAVITALATSNAFALDDCGRGTSDSEVVKRLDCLQRNNDELANHVSKLQEVLKHTLKDDAWYSLKTIDGLCLAGDPNGNFVRNCADVHGAKFRIHP
jgi:hypothetical protein